MVLRTDGACRGNPGPSAIAYVFEDEGMIVESHSEAIGEATSNVAEYRALIAGLRRAHERRDFGLEVVLDSTLLVNQMNGNWKVKHPKIRPLYAEAQNLAHGVGNVTFRWAGRDENADADALANSALGDDPLDVCPTCGQYWKGLP